MSATLPQPGWYEDPAEPSRLRRWDGAAWTTDVRPAPTPAAAAPAEEPAPFVPLDLGHVAGGHGGGTPDPRPEPAPFVPLDLGHVGGNGGPATDTTSPHDAPAGGLPASEPSAALPGPSATDVLPAAADSAKDAADGPGRLAGVRGRERPSWPVLSAGAAAVAAVVATAALTLGGGGDGPAVDPDAAYAACQSRVEELSEGEELGFAPHSEVTATETVDGMALDFWARSREGPERRRQRVELRCDVDTTTGEPSVREVYVGLEATADAAAIGG